MASQVIFQALPGSPDGLGIKPTLGHGHLLIRDMSLIHEASHPKLPHISSLLEEVELQVGFSLKVSEGPQKQHSAVVTLHLA